MATVTLRPDATVSNDWVIVGGGGTAHATLSDESNSTYMSHIGAGRVFDVNLDDMNFNNNAGEFGLYIKLTDGASFTMTGSIDVTGTNTNVPGTNTLYTSELSVGDEVVISGETRVISSITSDTTAVVSAAFGSDLANDTSPDCNPTALVDVIIV